MAVGIEGPPRFWECSCEEKVWPDYHCWVLGTENRCSHVEPYPGICYDTQISSSIPQLVVGLVPLWRDDKLREPGGRVNVGHGSSVLLVEVDGLEHELRGVRFVGEVHVDLHLVGTHAPVLVWYRDVVLGLAGHGITSVEYALDSIEIGISLLDAKVLEVARNPPSIDQDSARLVILVEVRVERSNCFIASLVIFLLFNIYLLVQIQVSFEQYWLHIPVLLSYVWVLASPGELLAVLWRDINWVFAERFRSSFDLILLVEHSAFLEVASLVDEEQSRHREGREYEFLAVHFIY